jgi:hypothetical protein
LTYDRAFGGRAWGADFETASADNPHGKGFVLTAERIEGTALPNIEEQDQLLTDPMQRSLPAGLAPLPRRPTEPSEPTEASAVTDTGGGRSFDDHDRALLCGPDILGTGADGFDDAQKQVQEGDRALADAVKAARATSDSAVPRQMQQALMILEL